MTSTRLQNAQAIAAIFAAIAVPVVVALVGWWIQTSISQQSVRKDYVQMAIAILSNPQSSEDKALRQWAIAMLDQNSPVPFSEDARSELAFGSIFIQPKVFRPILETPMMAPPEPWVELPANYTLEDLTDNYAENLRNAQHNYLGLKYLQEAVRAGAAAESSPPSTEKDGSE